MHQDRQGSSVSPVRGNVQGQDRGLAGGLSKVDAERRPATHFRRDRLGPIRLPADGEALHAAHYHQDVEHSRRFGNSQAFCQVSFLLVHLH